MRRVFTRATSVDKAATGWPGVGSRPRGVQDTGSAGRVRVALVKLIGALRHGVARPRGHDPCRVTPMEETAQAMHNTVFGPREPWSLAPALFVPRSGVAGVAITPD